MSQSRGSGNINMNNAQYYSSSRASNYVNSGSSGILGMGSSAASGIGNVNMPFQNMEYRGHTGAGSSSGIGGAGVGIVMNSNSSNSNSDPFYQHNMGSAFQDIHPLPQLSPSSSSSSSTGRMEPDRDNLWYFTADQLANSPSRRNGIDADQELSYRQMTACLIQEMGQRLQV